MALPGGWHPPSLVWPQWWRWNGSASWPMCRASIRWSGSGAQVAVLVSYTILWIAAGEVCTTRQAKRLFPIFASAGIVGAIAGNGLAGPLTSLLGAENLLLIHAALLVGRRRRSWSSLYGRFFPRGLPKRLRRSSENSGQGLT